MRWACLLIILLIAKESLAEPSGLSYNDNAIRVRVPFDTARSIIGSSRKGLLRDCCHTYTLSPLRKYRLKLNYLGDYDLFALNGKEQVKMGSVSIPFRMRSQGRTPFHLNGKWYRGEIEIRKDQIGVIAINSLSIDELIPAMLGAIASEQSSPEAIKASGVILRSSLRCILFNNTYNRQSYDLYATQLNYQGVSGEKSFINEYIRQTQGEILLNAYGDLSCTPLKVASVSGSAPFELIGYQTNAWERSISFEELTFTLRKAGYQANYVQGVERKILSHTGAILFSIQTDAGVIDLTAAQAKEMLSLPNEFFRMYSYKDRQGTTIMQLMGGLAGYKSNTNQHDSVFNLVDSIDQSRIYAYQDYESILKSMYPDFYLARL